MTQEHPVSFPEAVDVRHLGYFALVAEEGSVRRAAERLFMTQPPLSRHIRQLEERLGVALFHRHSTGLSLTPAGTRVLEIIRPLLALREATFRRLREEVRPQGTPLRLGLTTAFEQGVFAALEGRVRARFQDGVHIVRLSSPGLVREIRKGRLDAACVALPLDAPGLALQELPYGEPLVAAVPAAWPQADAPCRVPLSAFTGKPLFWFTRDARPTFFDHMKRRFARAGFSPLFLQEPEEHDVLLARIASGEAMGLLPASFAAITRPGLAYVGLADKEDMRMRLGLLTGRDGAATAEELATLWSGGALK